MKINIICAKKGRTEYYDIFLHYLNILSEGHDISLYVTSCEDAFEYTSEYFKNLKNIQVDHQCLITSIDIANLGFNKSKLLNSSISRMRPQYDAVCVFDIDMIYNLGFFDRVAEFIKNGGDYGVCYGKKLDSVASYCVFENIPEYGTLETFSGKNFAGCSQIVVTKKVLDILKATFGFIYDEKYYGWGGEDSDLSFKSTYFSILNIWKKEALKHCWYHLHHVSEAPENTLEFKNFKLFEDSKKGITDSILQFNRFLHEV